MQRLSIVGHSGMGALCYEPVTLITIDDMLAVGESIRIPKKRGMAIIDFVRTHCKPKFKIEVQKEGDRRFSDCQSGKPSLFP